MYREQLKREILKDAHQHQIAYEKIKQAIEKAQKEPNLEPTPEVSEAY